MVCHRIQSWATRPAVGVLWRDELWPLPAKARMPLQRDLAHLPLERKEIEENKTVIPGEDEETVANMREKATYSTKNPLGSGGKPRHCRRLWW